MLLAAHRATRLDYAHTRSVPYGTYGAFSYIWWHVWAIWPCIWVLKYHVTHIQLSLGTMWLKGSSSTVPYGSRVLLTYGSHMSHMSDCHSFLLKHFLHVSPPACNGFPWFTYGVTPPDLLETSMAVELFWPTHTHKHSSNSKLGSNIPPHSVWQTRHWMSHAGSAVIATTRCFFPFGKFWLTVVTSLLVHEDLVWNIIHYVCGNPHVRLLCWSTFLVHDSQGKSTIVFNPFACLLQFLFTNSWKHCSGQRFTENNGSRPETTNLLLLHPTYSVFYEVLVASLFIW